jgi:methionine sulfoxide reductase heme-binding subunit
MSAQLTQALWDLARGTGAVALVMLTLSLCLGVLTRSGRAIWGLGRFGVAELHRTAALTGVTLIAVHVGTLLFDPYAQLRLVDIVVPFTGAYRPMWLGLGTLAVDLLGVVVLVSLLRERVGPRVFRAVHWATYALWPVALLHALGTGTDAGAWWFRALAGGCALAVGSAVTWRLSAGYAERGWKRRPRVVTQPARDKAGLL